jgi:hypothetical protein
LAALAKLGKVATRALLALLVAAIAYPLAATAFHPFDGIVEGYNHSTIAERYLALTIAGVIAGAVLWRLLHGSTIREELDRAGDSTGGGDA